MARRLKIDREFGREDDLTFYLQDVAKKVEEGFTSGDGWSCYEEGDQMDDDSGTERFNSRLDSVDRNFVGD